MKIEIIFAEFGNINVDVDHFRSYFPEATFTLITDKKLKNNGFDNNYFIQPTFNPSGDKRYGWHMNDLWQIEWMFRSDADICIAFDADTRIVSEEVRTIIPLVKKFGLCLPANPRLMARRDASIGVDGGDISQEQFRNGFALNTSITAMDMKNRMATNCANKYCEFMRDNPQRAPLVWWKAIWHTGFFPCLLPFQWSLCNDHIGIPNPIILHTGHVDVKRHYNV